MKSNVLKTSLSAFVFTLAIVASFAFSATPSDLEDDPIVTVAYIQNGGDTGVSCVPKTVTCYESPIDGPICTFGTGPNKVQVFGNSDILPNIKCDLRLSTEDPHLIN